MHSEGPEGGKEGAKGQASTLHAAAITPACRAGPWRNGVTRTIGRSVGRIRGSRAVSTRATGCLQGSNAPPHPWQLAPLGRRCRGSRSTGVGGPRAEPGRAQGATSPWKRTPAA